MAPGPADPDTGSRDRRVPAAVAALLLAGAGVAAGWWRPLADLPAPRTELARFAPEVLAAARAYQQPGDVGAAVALVLRVGVPLLAVLTPPGRRLVARLAGPQHDPDGTDRSLARRAGRGGLVAAGILAAASLARLPLDVWLGWFHDTRWGFNTAGPLAWARDWLLANAIGWVAALVAGAVLVAALSRWPRSWHWRMVLIGTALTAALTFVYPLVVRPLFYDTRPLRDGPVRTEVQEVLAGAGLPDVPIEVGDASRRTTRVNAFVSGLGPSRRVLLFDTLLELPPEQVGLVVAHELAHRLHRDLLRGVLLSAAGLLVGVLALRWVLGRRRVRRAAGARGRADPRLIAVAVAVAVAVETALLPVAMAASRRAEAAADARAMELTGEPGRWARTARAFTVRDLARPRPPAPVRWLWGSHPTVAQRIRAAAGYAAANDLPLPDLQQVREDEADLRHPRIGDPR